jgi:hypothetical protein
MGVHKDEAYPKIKELLGIPVDEPIFILRAQDKLSIPMIARYQIMANQIDDGPDDAWHRNIDDIVQAFTVWQNEHTTKVPD